MKLFTGFPYRMDFTPIPNTFINHLMPQINDITELKITLHIFMSIYGKKGYPRFASFGELLGNISLMKSIGQSNSSVEKVLKKALELAISRGTILKLVVDYDGKQEELYFLNTAFDKQTIDKIQNGSLKLHSPKAKVISPIQNEELPNIFTIYEENIGMLTPMIADELKEAERLYPDNWIRDAIKEAVKQGKHKWSYIQAILERWIAEGREYGTHRRDFEKEDPDKYIKGKYGHMVRRR